MEDGHCVAVPARLSLSRLKLSVVDLLAQIAHSNVSCMLKCPSPCACSYMELRGPLDVINLATLFGLTQQQARMGSQCCMGCVVCSSAVMLPHTELT